MFNVKRERAHATSVLKTSILASSLRADLQGATGFEVFESSVVIEIGKPFLFIAGFACPTFIFLYLRNIIDWSL
jgi:hypothetical protein